MCFGIINLSKFKPAKNWPEMISMTCGAAALFGDCSMPHIYNDTSAYMLITGTYSDVYTTIEVSNIINGAGLMNYYTNTEIDN